MNRPALIAAATALLATPALAQQQQPQQQSPLGSTLENLGRALQGQGGGSGDRGLDRNDRSSRQDAYDRAYRDNAQAFRNSSDDELHRSDRQISQAWTELQAASRALDDEMARRGAAGSTRGDRPQDRGTDRYSGSSGSSSTRDADNDRGFDRGGSSYDRPRR